MLQNVLYICHVTHPNYGEERAEIEKDSMPDLRKSHECGHIETGWCYPIFAEMQKLQEGKRSGNKRHTIESFETIGETI